MNAISRFPACRACDPPARPDARASVRTETRSSSLKLQLRTAEGDTVEISLTARNQRQTERARGQGVSYRSDARSQDLTASVNITGDLNESELADIRELLSSLSSGNQPTDLDTISAYQYTHQRTREVSRATVQLYA